MSLPINTVAGPDNPNPAIHYVVQGHDIDIGSGGVRFGFDFLGIAFHGDCHSHMDAMCHLSWQGQTYNGKPALEVLTTRGATCSMSDAYSTGLVGRGVLFDIPRCRGAWSGSSRARRSPAPSSRHTRRPWDSSVGEGDIFVFRTGHHRRRLALGPWDNSAAGAGKAGLHVDTIPWMHERRISAFLPDGDGEAVPGSVDGIAYPIHPLQLVAMGMLTADSLQLEDVAEACQAEGRLEFMVVGLPLRIVGGTGSPWNPIAIF